MTEPDAPLPTLLPDLGALTLADLRARAGLLAEDQEVLCGQVERPRINLGTGPPGRAD